MANLRRGIVERVFHVERGGQLVTPPRPSEGWIRTGLGDFARAIRRWLPRSTPVTRIEFAEMYKGRKHTIYANAVESLSTRPVSRRDAQVGKAFVKAEKVNFSSKPDPAPRIIHPRDPRYNVEVGRFLKPLEHRIYWAIQKVWGGPTVMKGLNAEQVAGCLRQKWSSFRNPVAVGLDASRFDQHVSLEALEWEHHIYGLCFSGPDKNLLETLLRWQLRNRCTGRASDGNIRYTVEGCRMSGDMNTALGNCLLMCAMVWSYCQHTIGGRAALANNGDDCMVFMEREDLKRFTRDVEPWFLKMGFTMKVEAPAYDFEKVEFCQTRPIWTPDGWIMVRNYPNALAKDCTSIVPLDTEKGARKWMNAVGRCGMSLTGGVPIYQEFYQFLMDMGLPSGTDNHPIMECGMTMMAVGMERGRMPVHPRTRYSFWLAFGITPDQQEIIEEYYRSVSRSWATPTLTDLEQLDHLPKWSC